jgi:hypothetical protein
MSGTLDKLVEKLNVAVSDLSVAYLEDNPEGVTEAVEIAFRVISLIRDIVSPPPPLP